MVENSMLSQKISISSKEFLQIKNLIYEKSGIRIIDEDIVHLENKLQDRLALYNMSKFRDYYNLLLKNPEELQAMINTVTTNETYFYREERHFDFLKKEILPKVKYEKFRCWSAAGSNGAEGYSIAMDVDFTLSTYQNWEVLITDINDEVLNYAKEAKYPLKYAKRIPKEYLRQYCLKGQNEEEGFFRINDKLKRNIIFKQLNLLDIRDSDLGVFDVIFLRNMIIYFDDTEKKIIVENVIKYLKKGGYLFMGHSESLYRITNKVQHISPSIDQKV